MPESLVDDKSKSETGKPRPEYAPPTVTPIGNARDLLAGNAGSVPDAVPIPGKPTQPSTP
jgi:hypothetical protein